MSLRLDAAPPRRRRRGLECFVHTQDWDCALGDEIDDGGDPPRIWFAFGVLFFDLRGDGVASMA